MRYKQEIDKIEEIRGYWYDAAIQLRDDEDYILSILEETVSEGYNEVKRAVDELASGDPFRLLDVGAERIDMALGTLVDALSTIEDEVEE